MKSGKGGKSPVVCEVCPDHVRHSMSIVVGHKLSGTPRVIHDRAKCRQRWARERDRIMARWPEHRTQVVVAHPEVVRALQQTSAPLAQFKPVAHMVAETGRVQELHGLDPELPDALQIAKHALELDAISQAAQAARREQAVAPTPTLHEPEKLSRKYTYKPELDVFIVEHFKRYAWRRGAAAALHVLLQNTHPDLLVDTRGVPITQGTLSSHVSSVLAKQTLKVQETTRQEAAKLGAELHAQQQQQAAELGGRIATGIMALVAAGDVATLKAVADLMDGR